MSYQEPEPVIKIKSMADVATFFRYLGNSGPILSDVDVRQPDYESYRKGLGKDEPVSERAMRPIPI